MPRGDRIDHHMQWVVKEKKGSDGDSRVEMRVVSVEVRSGGGLDRKF